MVETDVTVTNVTVIDLLLGNLEAVIDLDLDLLWVIEVQTDIVHALEVVHVTLPTEIDLALQIRDKNREIIIAMATITNIAIPVIATVTPNRNQSLVGDATSKDISLEIVG